MALFCLTITSAKGANPLPEFNKEQQVSFKELKRRLMSTRILALPRCDVRYIVETDSSKDKLGAVLLQEQPDKAIMPVGCRSRSLTPAEMNYSTT